MDVRFIFILMHASLWLVVKETKEAYRMCNCGQIRRFRILRVPFASLNRMKEPRVVTVPCCSPELHIYMHHAGDIRVRVDGNAFVVYAVYPRFAAAADVGTGFIRRVYTTHADLKRSKI